MACSHCRLGQDKRVLSCPCQRCEQAISCKLETGSRRDKTHRNWVETRQNCLVGGVNIGDKTRQFCLVRVSGVNKPLQTGAAATGNAPWLIVVQCIAPDNQSWRLQGVEVSIGNSVQSIMLNEKLDYSLMEIFDFVNGKITNTLGLGTRVYRCSVRAQWRCQAWGTGARAPLEFANTCIFCSRSSYGCAYLSAEFS